ncbi:hypothetical protein OPQ81_000026 [Rhizoctonia solani]|nr:hypothetical protein OPQ81_000026 [Rhizoctonia solani]
MLFPPTPASPVPRSEPPSQPKIALSTSASPVIKELQPSLEPQTDDQSARGSMAWSGMKTLLDVVESSADAFGPFKSVIGALNRCIAIYERAYKGRKDYYELRDKLVELLNDLKQHLVNPMGPLMTNSVKRLCAELEMEVNIVEKKLARSTGQQLMEAIDTPDEIVDCYRRIQGHLERLTLNANLNMLDLNMRILKAIGERTTESRLLRISPSMSAIYNSAEKDDIGRGGCTPGTRGQQIRLLLDWASDPDAGRTCWMNGMAGTGKTTIAYSVCTKLDEARGLAASFFCSRTLNECRQVKNIIPSIAYQLARFSFTFRCALVMALEADPDAHTRALDIQYERLIVEPLMKVQGSLPMDLIVVIDALDECENENSVGQILDLLLSPQFNLPIRFLVSSRPEPEINRRMTARIHKQGDNRLVLHDLDSDSVKSDIKIYMKHELKHIPLTDAQWSGLIDRCGVFFIYASTACRYLEQAHRTDTVDEALNTIMGSASTQMEIGDKTGIDELYRTILTAAFNKSGMSQVNKGRMQTMLETIICAAEPIGLHALMELIGLGSIKQVEGLLQPLRSVLNVHQTTGLVSTLHASFPDFMFSPDRSGAFHCPEARRHAVLAEGCLQLINGVSPKFNICRLPSSYLFDDEVENLEKRVQEAISPGMIYACRHWSKHISLGEHRPGHVDCVRDFFSTRLLVWMEILNLTGLMRYGTGIIREAEKWCSEQLVPHDVTKLAHDAWEFVSVFANHPVSRSTPHIYVSMLPFWPQARPISQAYIPRTAGMIQQTGTTITRRRLALLGTWQFSDQRVYSMDLSAAGTRLVVKRGLAHSVAISPDGSQIAYFFLHSTLHIWDTRNEGKTTQLPPEFRVEVHSISFSPSQPCLAFGSKDGGVYIYSLQRAEVVLGPLKGHTKEVKSVAFSPGGIYLASGSNDGTAILMGSASDDKTIRVWNPQTGQTVLGPLEEHSDAVIFVAFSPNGRFIASGSADHTIRVYDAQTGQTVIGPLEAHTSWVYSVIFSPDNARLFSCSYDGTIRIWNVQDLDTPDVAPPMPSVSNATVSIRYSHSGSRLASGSKDGSIHIWGVQARELVLGPLRGHTDYVWSVDYSPNDAYIASASNDSTLRIWDAWNGSDLHGPIRVHDKSVNCIRFSPDGLVVASASDDGTVRISDVASGQPVATLLGGNDDPIYSVGFSPDGLRIACGSETGTVRVFDRQTGEPLVGPLQAHVNTVISVEYSQDGSRILSSSWDKSIRIWNAETGQQIVVCGEQSLAHDRNVNSASFSPDGHYIVSGSEDQTVRVWDAQTGNLILGPLEGHQAWVRSVQFSPDGSHVVSCSDDCTIRFWDVSGCINKAQEGRTQDDSKSDNSCRDVGEITGAWSLDSDGWVLDREGRRLVWVPSDLHRGFLPTLNDSIITDEPWFKPELDGALTGERWTDCYRP